MHVRINCLSRTKSVKLDLDTFVTRTHFVKNKNVCSLKVLHHKVAIGMKKSSQKRGQILRRRLVCQLSFLLFAQCRLNLSYLLLLLCNGTSSCFNRLGSRNDKSPYLLSASNSLQSAGISISSCLARGRSTNTDSPS